MPDIDADEFAATGGAATARPAVSREAAVWADTTDGWSDQVPFSIDPDETGERRVGAYEGTQKIYVPEMNRLWLAKGANNHTITAADSGRILTFDTSVAARTVTFPDITTLPHGFNVGLMATSTTFPLILNPDTADNIGGLADNTNLEVKTSKQFEVRSDGANWHTTLDHQYLYVAAAFTGVSTILIGNLPNSVNRIEFTFRTKFAVDANALHLRTAEVDQVIDVGGADYFSMIKFTRSNPNNDYAQVNGASSSMVMCSGIDNAWPITVLGEITGLNEADYTFVDWSAYSIDSTAAAFSYNTHGKAHRNVQLATGALSFTTNSGNFAGSYSLRGYRF